MKGNLKQLANVNGPAQNSSEAANT